MEFVGSRWEWRPKKVQCWQRLSRKMLVLLTTWDHKKRSMFQREDAKFIPCIMNYFTRADIPKVRTKEMRNEHLPRRCPMVWAPPVEVLVGSVWDLFSSIYWRNQPPIWETWVLSWLSLSFSSCLQPSGTFWQVILKFCFKEFCEGFSYRFSLAKRQSPGSGWVSIPLWKAIHTIRHCEWKRRNQANQVHFRMAYKNASVRVC